MGRLLFLITMYSYLWRCFPYVLTSRNLIKNRSLSSYSTKPFRNILALDFDGVICASSIESSYSAIIAANNLWPHIFGGIVDDQSRESFKKLQLYVQYLRPVIETGYETMLISRYLFENMLQDCKDVTGPRNKSEVASGNCISVEEISVLNSIASQWLNSKGNLRDSLITEYKTDKVTSNI